MKAHLIDTHLLVPRSRSSAKIKVKYRDHVSQKMDVSGALVFHKPSCFSSTEELVTILSTDCPAEYPEGFYNMYVNLVLSIFHYACRNLTELKYLVSDTFFTPHSV